LPSEPTDFAAQINTFDFAIDYRDMLGKDDRSAARERARLAQEDDLTAAPVENLTAQKSM